MITPSRVLRSITIYSRKRFVNLYKALRLPIHHLKPELCQVTLLQLHCIRCLHVIHDLQAIKVRYTLANAHYIC